MILYMLSIKVIFSNLYFTVKEFSKKYAEEKEKPLFYHNSLLRNFLQVSDHSIPISIILLWLVYF